MKKVILIIYLLFILIPTSELYLNQEAKIRSYYINVIQYKPNFNNKIIGKSLAIRNNNPGNLKYSNDFARFNTMEHGYLKLINDLTIKTTGKSIHLDSTATLQDFCNVYCPKHENNTDKYINDLCVELNVKRDTMIKYLNIAALAKAIIKLEDITIYKSLY